MRHWHRQFLGRTQPPPTLSARAISEFFTLDGGEARAARYVHLLATNSRCQRNKVAGDTSGSSPRSAFIRICFASVPSVRRSASVKMIRLGPSLDRSTRFSAFKYSICATDCRSSQQAMLARSSVRNCFGIQAIRGCYGRAASMPIRVYEHYGIVPLSFCFPRIHDLSS
jgi:hypothetical protein